VIDPYDPTDGFSTDGGYEYPSVEDAYAAHETVLEEDEDAEPGVVNEGAVDRALNEIRYRTSDCLVEQAALLFVRIVEGHEFADGNKRTAIYVVEEFFRRNGVSMEMTGDVFVVSLEVARGDAAVSEVEEVLREATE